MAETYFVRSRGRVTGPFDVPALQKLVRRGMISRAHELSADRQAWTSAADVVELFPPAVSASVAPAASAGTAAPAATGLAGGTYYYVREGQTVGPVPAGVMVSLIRAAAIGPDDIVWADGGQTAQVAATVPALAAAFGAGGSVLGYAGRSTVATRPASAADRARGRALLDQTAAGCQVTGIVAGVAMLLFLNLPVTSAADGRLVWWWDALGKPGGGTAGVVLFFVLFAGLTAVPIGAAARGLVRGYVFVSLATVGFTLLLVVGLSESTSEGGLVFSLALPVLAAALVGVSYFRGRVPESGVGRVFQAVIGGLLAGGTLITAVVGMARESGFDVLRTMGQVPGWAIMAFTVAGIGTAAGLAAGVLGLVGMKSRYSAALNGNAIGFAGGSVLLPFTAAVIFIGGIAPAERAGLVVFLAVRVLAVAIAFLSLLAAGLAEVFVASHVGSLARVPPRVV